MDLDALAARLRKHGQDHVLRFFDSLTDDQRDSLTAQLASVDFDLLQRIAGEAGSSAEDETAPQRARRARTPSDFVRLPQTSGDNEAWQRAYETGEKALHAGRVGAILVAGGEATRLGSNTPKGMFPIGPVSNKSLFQLLAEQ